MTFVHALILILAGIAVGFINTIAGGGSAISLSVLILLGLPAGVANGTNRIAILIQNIGASLNYKRLKVLESKKGLFLALPAIIGAVVGSWIAVDINEVLMRRVIGILLLVVLVVMILNPKKWLEGKESEEIRLHWWHYVIFFFIGIYGGFIHVGVGYALLTGIVLAVGYDLVRANAMKVLIILLWTPLSLLMFYYNHEVNLIYGLVMGIGNLIGALIASQLSVKKGAGFVRILIIIITLAMSAYLLGFFPTK